MSVDSLASEDDETVGRPTNGKYCRPPCQVVAGLPLERTFQDPKETAYDPKDVMSQQQQREHDTGGTDPGGCRGLKKGSSVIAGKVHLGQDGRRECLHRSGRLTKRSNLIFNSAR